MKWVVELHGDFEVEFDTLPAEVKNELAAGANLLEAFGPELGRPRVDTLKGSKYSNMKELRFDAADGVWRVAFAYKSGGSESHFYKQLIKKADTRFSKHLAQLEGQ